MFKKGGLRDLIEAHQPARRHGRRAFDFPRACHDDARTAQGLYNVVRRLADEVAKGLRQSDVLDIFEKQGLQSAAGRPEELAALVAGEVTKWAKVIKAANIPLQ